MRRLAALVLAAAATLTASAPARPVHHTPQYPDPPTCGTPGVLRMMAYGDSKTAGVGYGSDTSPIGWLNNRMVGTGGLTGTQWVGSQVYGGLPMEAYPGVTILTMTGRADTAIPAYQPDIMLVDLGTNDAAEVDGDVIRDRWADLLDAILVHPCVRVSIAQSAIWWGAAVPGARMQYANKLLPALVAAKNAQYGLRVRVVDMQALQPALGHYAGDWEHLSAAGNDIESCWWYYAGVAPWVGSGRLPATVCPTWPVQYQ